MTPNELRAAGTKCACGNVAYRIIDYKPICLGCLSAMLAPWGRPSGPTLHDDDDPEARYERSKEGQAWAQQERDEDFVRRYLK